MKRLLIIVACVTLTTMTANAQQNSITAPNKIILNINKIIEGKEITQITPLEELKLRSYVQSLEEYPVLTDPERFALSSARRVLRYRFSTRIDTFRSKLFAYINGLGGKYEFMSDENDPLEISVKNVSSHIYAANPLKKKDVSMMQQLFAYYVDLLENTEKPLRTIPSTFITGKSNQKKDGFEEDILAAMFLQETLLDLLKTGGDIATPIDVNTISKLSDQLVKAIDASHLSIEDGIYEIAKDGYMREITERAEKIGEFIRK